jgi:hypothetical protein
LVYKTLQMKSKLLLPSQFKLIGFLLLIPSVILGYLILYQQFEFSFLDVRISNKSPEELSMFESNYNNLTNEITLTGVLSALLLIAFARLKTEDEFIHFIRLESWQWAVVVNFFLLIAATWIFYGSNFIDVMIYNMLTIPILFIIRFHFLLFRAKRSEAKTYAL